MWLGLVFPLHFLQAANSISFYLDGWEVLLCYGTAYVAYALISAAPCLVAWLLWRAIVAAGWNPGAWLGAWGGASLLLVCVAASIHWQFDFPSQLSLAGKVAIVGAAVLLAWPFAASAAYRSAVRIGATLAWAGAVAALVTAVTVCGRWVVSAPVAAAAQVKPGPLVVWISFDTFSALHSSVYGYSRKTTPNLERLAEDSIVFERSYANANMTTPAFASVLRGQRPWLHRQLHLQSAGQAGEHSLLDALAASGYRIDASLSNIHASPQQHGLAGAVNSTAMGQPNPYNQFFLACYGLGLNQGFSTVGFLPRVADLLGRLSTSSVPGRHYDPAPQFEFARTTLTLHPAGARLLWIHLFPPHDPYVSPAPFLGAFDPSARGRTLDDSSPPYTWRSPGSVGDLEGRYDEDLLFADAELGGFLDWMRAAGIYDDAYIFVNADHGESFHFGYGGHTGPLLSEELIRVPWLLKVPRSAVKMRIDTPVEQADFAPTLLSSLGLDIPSSMTGRSLLQQVAPSSWEFSAPPRPVFAMNFEQSRDHGTLQNGSVAMIDGRWKYVLYRGRLDYPGQPSLAAALYDLASDPQGERDVAAGNPARTRAMAGEIESELARNAR